VYSRPRLALPSFFSLLQRIGKAGQTCDFVCSELSLTCIPRSVNSARRLGYVTQTVLNYSDLNMVQQDVNVAPGITRAGTLVYASEASSTCAASNADVARIWFAP
jgi:hypothetical protein